MVHPTPLSSDNTKECDTTSDNSNNDNGDNNRDAVESGEASGEGAEQRDNQVDADQVAKEDDGDHSSNADVADNNDNQVVQLVRQHVTAAQQQQQQQGHPTLDPNQTYILAGSTAQTVVTVAVVVCTMLKILFLSVHLGPYTRYDQRRQMYVNYFSARPVPKGMTVIAAPIMQYASAAYPAGGAPSAKQVSMLQTFTARSAHSPASPSAPPIFSDAPSPSPSPSVPSTPSCPSPTPSASSGFNPNAAPFFPKSESKIGNMGATTDVKLKTKRTPCFMYWSSQHPEGTLIPFRQPQPPVYFPN